MMLSGKSVIIETRRGEGVAHCLLSYAVVFTISIMS
jgi:hypothetical protein